MKKFVVTPGIKYYYFAEISDEDIYIVEEPFISEDNRIKANFIRIAKKIGLKRFYTLFLQEWKEKLMECDACIIFDQAYSESLVFAIKKFNPKIKINLYIWNISKNNQNFFRKITGKKDSIRIWSFDKVDCTKFGLEFSPMVYNFNEMDSICDSTSMLNYDVLFVGYLKQRGALISEIYRLLQDIDAKAYFYVVRSDSIHNNLTEELPFELHDSYLPYVEYRNILMKSRVVLDVTESDQVGLTIRTLETIRYKRKLITNNTDIKSYDFYNKNNIFIFGVDDLNTLPYFMKSPYIDVAPSLLKKYNFTDWVKKF